MNRPKDDRQFYQNLRETYGLSKYFQAHQEPVKRPPNPGWNYPEATNEHGHYVGPANRTPDDWTAGYEQPPKQEQIEPSHTPPVQDTDERRFMNQRGRDTGEDEGAEQQARGSFEDQPWVNTHYGTDPELPFDDGLPEESADGNGQLHRVHREQNHPSG